MSFLTCSHFSEILYVQVVRVYLQTHNSIASQITLDRKTQTDTETFPQIYPKISLLDIVAVRDQRTKGLPKMEAGMEQRIEKTVRKILETSNMDDVTEYKIRKQASEDLGLDLSKPPYKAFVRQVVESFLEVRQQRQEQAGDEEEEEGEGEERQDGRDYDDEGNLIICKVCFPLPPAFIFPVVLFGC